jgi:hypothetical protein
MPQEALTIIRPGYAYNAITWPGPTYTVVAAAGALTQAAYDSGTAPYFGLKQKPGIPFNGMFLVISIPGPVSCSGAAAGTTSAIPSVTFADASVGPAVGYTHTLAPITFTYVANVGTCTNLNGQGVAIGAGGATLFWRLPETRHAFIRVQIAATTFTGGITGCNYGLVNIAIQDDVDTEANNHGDLG